MWCLDSLGAGRNTPRSSFHQVTHIIQSHIHTPWEQFRASNLQYGDVFRLWEKAGVTTRRPMEALGVRRAINSLYKSPYQEKDAAEEKLWKASLFAVDMTSERSQDGTVEGLVAVTKHPHTPSYTHPPTQPLMSGTRLCCWFEFSIFHLQQKQRKSQSPYREQAILNSLVKKQQILVKINNLFTTLPFEHIIIEKKNYESLRSVSKVVSSKQSNLIDLI